MIELKVNGETRRFDGDPDMPLLSYLRDVLELRGTKFGCGAGLCGSRTIHFDGAPMRSCITPIAAAQGAEIVTIEGLSENRNHPTQQAWVEGNVPQCGYCQSGQIMAAAHLLKTIPNPTDEDVDSHFAGNICRCGTYQRIRKAVKRAAEIAS